MLAGQGINAACAAIEEHQDTDDFIFTTTSKFQSSHISSYIITSNAKMVFEGTPERSVKKKLSYSLPSPGPFDLERGPDPGNPSPSRSYTRQSDDVPGSGASDKPLNATPGSPGHHGIGRHLPRMGSVLHRTFTQQFRAADSGEKQPGFRNLFGSGKQAGKHWKGRELGAVYHVEYVTKLK